MQLELLTDESRVPERKPRRARKPRAQSEYSLSISGLPVVREAAGKIKGPLGIAALCEDMSRMSQEAFVVFTLNGQNAVIDRHLITLGLANASLVHPREVFRVAIQDGACAVILAHNHPSGDPTPSSEDLRITKQLVEAGRIVEIKVLDHITIGRKLEAGQDGFLSLREAALVDFA